MALIVNLKCVENLAGKADRFAKLTYREHTYTSKTVNSSGKVAYFGETFEWPVARPAESSEIVDIQILNYNKYLNNKLVGQFSIILQQLIQDGEIKVCEPLVDINNRTIEAYITFDVLYYSPDGKVGKWEQEEFTYPLIDDESRLPREDVDDRDGSSMVRGQLPGVLQETASLRSFSSGPGLMLDMTGEDTASQTAMMDAMFQAKNPYGYMRKPELLDQELHKPKDFQICITIIEGLQLAGLNIDPVVQIRIGDQKKYTSIRQSTNNPFYNEYFVFDFCESPAMLFDKMITITAMHSINLPGRQVFKAGNMLAGRVIGQFKCDVGTVYSSQDHQYYHKWAVLIDPKDMGEGVKGYLKCDISVLGRGDVAKIPKHHKEDSSDNIEGNLLLPMGVPAERQRAIYQVTIYRGEDFPRTDFGIMASLRKAITTKNVAFIDAFVKVSFVGHVGKTSVKKSYNPEWCEVITFVDMFPPLCNRFKLQICDSDVTSDDAIGTHFIELAQIMDPGGDAEGILPTYGPNWVNFYGSPRNYTFMGDHEDLDEGLGEGAAYKGRVLMKIQTEILDGESGGPSTVLKDKLRDGKIENPPRREFLLFCTLFEATMIDKMHKDKNIYFEISLGQYGNTLDAKPQKTVFEGATSDGEEEEEEDDKEESLLIKKKRDEDSTLPCYSTTPPSLPETLDKDYYHMAYNENKPCMYVVGKFEDLRKRLYHVNLLEKITDSFDDGLEDVRQMIRVEHELVHRRLRGVLDDFSNGCEKYLSQASALAIGSGSGKTNLDKYRLKMCRNNIDKLKTTSADLRRKITRENVNQRFKEARDMVRRMRHLCKEPQHSIPDVLIWMISDKSRIAYHRIPAKDLVHATQADHQGKHCGKLQTIFLRKPGKKAMGSSGWVMQGKLEMYFWFGMRDPKKRIKEYLEGLPKGFELSEEMKAAPLPPKVLSYPERHVFQLRAYLFQARNLLGSDDTGLSDPFARIIITNQCKTTQVQFETLCPNWDETLLFKEVVLYGPIDQIIENPPMIIIEIYDFDQVGRPEFLGRSMVKPHLKTSSMPYAPPDFPAQLEWWDVFRGPRQAGELLGAFELLQGDDLPEEPPVVGEDKISQQPILGIPPSIKPTLSRFKLEVAFWGVRQLKRINMMSVDRPKVDLVIGGFHPLSSPRISDINKNCNFDEPCTSMFLDLPDNELFWPPITLRVMDIRNFGRETLVGTATISNVTKYVHVPEEEKRRKAEAEFQQKERIRLEREREKERLALREQIANGQQPNDTTIIDLDTATLVPSMAGGMSANRMNMPLHPGPGEITHGSVNGRGPPSQGQPPSGKMGLNGSVKAADVAITVDPAGPGSVPPGPGMMMQDPARNLPMVEVGGVVVDVGGVGPSGAAGIIAIMPPPGPPPGVEEKTPGYDDDGELDTETKEKNRKQRRELILDLDWWSKYYVTMEDIRKASAKEQEDGEDDDSDYDIDDSDDDAMHLNVVNYANMNSAGLKKLQDAADDKKKKEDMEKEKKKKKKKKKKGKGAKKKMKNLKGKFNKAFAKDDGDNIDEDMDGFDPEDAEDKTYIARIKHYSTSLEDVPAFEGFTDRFETIELYRGKKLDDEEEDSARVSGKLKFNILIYKTNEKEEKEEEEKESMLIKAAKKTLAQTPLAPTPKLKLAKHLPSSKPFEVQVLVYILQAKGLHPVDFNGKADPYMVVKCGRKETNDKPNKQNNILDPVFGRLFEFDAVFPMDSMLKIQVMDYDTFSADDLIGETHIDLENRFFSKYRASCGISDRYEQFGYNIWRDPQKPSAILMKLCSDHKITPPEYKATCVRCGGKTFYAAGEVETESGDMLPTNENLALEVLKHFDQVPGGFPLVPEHIESRQLYNPEQPGVQMGKLEMWIDMFPKDMPPPSVSVDITPRQPKCYELRCIIWNTDEVVLEDTNMLTGEQSSDIYVKGYLKGKGEDDQQTDVHYRSMTGEGNFNWRFVWPFEYLKAEEKITYKKKETVFDMTETVMKVPAKLTMQVWDADLVSADDFLGSVTLDLNRMPRPAKNVKNCKISMLEKNGTVPTLNLFKQKRCKGWWPLAAKDDEGARIVGKVEVEMALLTIEEAEKSPAGLGREEPDALGEPKRPDTSFLWILNPMKTFRYIFWNNYKWLIFKVLVALALIALLVLFFYNMPGATVSKIWGL